MMAYLTDRLDPTLIDQTLTDKSLAAPHRMYPAQKILSRIGLHDVPVSSGLHGFSRNMDRVKLAQEDDAGLRGYAADLSRCFNSAGPMQPDVQQHYIGPKLLSFGNRFVAIGGFTDDVQRRIPGEK